MTVRATLLHMELLSPENQVEVGGGTVKGTVEL